jgi:hypothetical protein
MKVCKVVFTKILLGPSSGHEVRRGQCGRSWEGEPAARE